jgi:predicted PurR-regulated permease PerM
MALWDRVRALSPLQLPADPTALVVDAATRVASFVAPRAGGVLRDVAQFLFSLTVMLFALFFLLRDGAGIVSTIRRLLPFDDSRRDRLITQTRDLILASVGAGLAVAAVQGFIGGATYAALGVPAPVLWGVVTAFCALLPVVGATIVWLPVALYLFFSGEPTRAVIMVVVGVFGIGLVDNILRPFMMSGRSEANGLVMFIGLLGGVAAFGFIGLVLGPIVLVAAGTLLEACIGVDEA